MMNIEGTQSIPFAGVRNFLNDYGQYHAAQEARADVALVPVLTAVESETFAAEFDEEALSS